MCCVCCSRLKKIWCWIVSDHPKKSMNETEKLLFSIKITSKCRYQASVRLSLYNRFCFFTTTILSLGLIFVPLMQIAEVKLYFDTQIINAMQVFLAVSVLVFSNKISSSDYAIRAKNLNVCGDALKKLARMISSEMMQNEESTKKKELTQEQIKKYTDEYSNITEKYENHIRTDYKQTLFEAGNERITGLRWISLKMQIAGRYSLAYFIPTCLIIFEIALIFDMLGIFNLFYIFHE